MYKFAILIASAAAVSLATPDESRKSFEAARVAAANTVKAQNDYENKWLDNHESNLDNAWTSTQQAKEKVWKARVSQLANGNQYPAFKTYDNKWAAEKYN